MSWNEDLYGDDASSPDYWNKQMEKEAKRAAKEEERQSMLSDKEKEEEKERLSKQEEARQAILSKISKEEMKPQKRNNIYCKEDEDEQFDESTGNYICHKIKSNVEPVYIYKDYNRDGGRRTRRKRSRRVSRRYKRR